MPFIVRIQSSSDREGRTVDKYVYANFDLAFDQVCEDVKDTVMPWIETLFMSETLLKIEDNMEMRDLLKDEYLDEKEVKVAQFTQAEGRGLNTTKWFIRELQDYKLKQNSNYEKPVENEPSKQEVLQ